MTREGGRERIGILRQGKCWHAARTEKTCGAGSEGQ